MSENMKVIRELSLAAFNRLRKLIRNRWRWLLATFIFLLMGYVSGFGTGWWWSHGRLSSFPQVDSNTRLMVLSPHPDDEVLIAGGLIQRVLENGGQVKVVYLTTGDSSVGSVIKLDKDLKLSPSEFVDLANRRHDEALKAMKILGVDEKSLFFLGFPDQGLREVLSRERGDARGPVVSRSTKIDHVAYQWAYKDGQEYYLDNLIEDLVEISSSFKPNIVVTTHPLDSHPDHKAASEIVDILKSKSVGKFDVFYALVHYSHYPNKGFLFPPRKLFNDRWYSLELSNLEMNLKKDSLDQYSSQVSGYEKGWYMRFVAPNEIFEF